MELGHRRMYCLSLPPDPHQDKPYSRTRLTRMCTLAAFPSSYAGLFCIVETENVFDFRQIVRGFATSRLERRGGDCIRISFFL